MICIESRVLVISLSPPLFHPLFFRETNPILLSSSLRVLTRIQDFFEFIHDQATTGEYHIHGSFDPRTTLSPRSNRPHDDDFVSQLFQTSCKHNVESIAREFYELLNTRVKRVSTTSECSRYFEQNRCYSQFNHRRNFHPSRFQFEGNYRFLEGNEWRQTSLPGSAIIIGEWSNLD